MATKFTGRVVSGGETIFEKVTGYYTVTQGRNLATWSGVLTVESGEPIYLFGEAVLETTAGERWEVFGRSLDPLGNEIQLGGSGPAD